MAIKIKCDSSEGRAPPKVERGRFWCFLIYPDSTLSELSAFDRFAVPAAVSPLHTPSMDDGEEDELKPHYHVLLDFGRAVGDNMPIKISDQFSGVRPFRCANPKSYYLYLTHQNAPDKQQFPAQEPILYCGFEPLSFSVTDDYLSWIYTKIVEQNLTSFAQVIMFCMAENPFALTCASKNSYAISIFISNLNGGKKNDC